MAYIANNKMQMTLKLNHDFFNDLGLVIILKWCAEETRVESLNSDFPKASNVLAYCMIIEWASAPN